MHLPPEILDVNGDPGFGTIFLRGSNGEVLMEFGQMDAGVNRSCYVLTSTDDTIVVHFSLKPGVADFVDLQVDGIVRESQSHSTSKLEKEFKNSFRTVWHRERHGKGVLGVVKNCRMQVVQRDQGHDKFNGAGPFSEVGSLKLLLIRKKEQSPDNPTQKSGGAVDSSAMSSMYDEYSSWWEVNSNIDPDTIASPFEVEFIDKSFLRMKTKERATTKREGDFEVVGVLTFHLGSTSDLRARGFPNVPEYQAIPILENTPQPQSGTKATPTPKTNQKSLSTQEPESPKPTSIVKGRPTSKDTPAPKLTLTSKKPKAVPVVLDQDCDTLDSINVWSSKPQSKLFVSATQSSAQVVGSKASSQKASMTKRKTIKSESLQQEMRPAQELESRALTPRLAKDTVASPQSSPIAADRANPSTPSTVNRRMLVEAPRNLSPLRTEANGQRNSPSKTSFGNSLLAKVSLASIHKKDRSSTNFDNSVRTSASARSTEPSPTPTETPTDVATEEEVEALCQRDSQVTSDISPPTASANLQTPDNSHKEQNSKSAAAFNDQNGSDDIEELDAPPTQARLHWQSRSGSNEVSSSTRPMVSEGSIPTSPTPLSRHKTPKQPDLGTATKRKVDSLSGGDVFVERPLKKPFSSVPNSTPDTQRKLSTAQERLATAEKQRKKLLEQLELAKQTKKANELTLKAEKLEQENAELEATIAELYASG